MFDHAEKHEILTLLRSIHHDQLHFRDIFMASISEVTAAQATETLAITDLSARVAALPQGAATAAELDGVVATTQSNTAAIQAIAPAA